MLYTINLSNYNSSYKKIMISKFKVNALHRLKAFPFNTTEKLLDVYLKENYKVTLNYACYLIILHCKVEEIKDGLSVVLTDKWLNKIARLITYGTGRLCGSRILAFILNKL